MKLPVRAIVLSVALLLVATLSLPARAETAPAVRAEIAALLADLRASGCRFERNGRWYDGERAAAHLQRKLDWADGTDIPSTEAFIDAAATQSSFSGRAYRAQCGTAEPVASAAWFRARLAAIRARAPTVSLSRGR